MTDFRPFSQFENRKPPARGLFSWVDNCSSLRNGNALGLGNTTTYKTANCSSLRNGNALGLGVHTCGLESEL